MKIYLHIGYPKTGSTAIQWHVFANRRWFEDRGIYVPRTGYWSGLGHAYLIGPHNAETSLTPEGPIAVSLARELDACSRKNYKAVLLTWEGFALANDDAISALGKALDGHDVEVLAYIRDQASLFQSLVLQGLKNLHGFSLAATVVEGRPVSSVPDYLDFDTVFSRWKSLFSGQLTVRTRLFDRAVLQEGDIVTDFLHWLGLAPDQDFCHQHSGINESLSTEGALQLINARSAGLPWEGMIRLSRALTAAHTDHRSGSNHFLDNSGVELVKARFFEGNARLFEHYRPENVAPTTCEFTWPEQSSAQIEARTMAYYFRAVQLALLTPKLSSWGGGHLRDKNVGELIVPPNQGWRGPEKTGAWSSGTRSELAFNIPATHPTCGPNAIRLTLTGIYIEGHHVTRVIIEDRSELLDLRGDIVLTVPITDSVRRQGVRILLDHQFPTTAVDNASSIAYKLRAAAYDFVWS